MTAAAAKTKNTPERELWKCRGYGKRGKPKAGFPLFPQPLGNLAKDRRDSHISTAPATKADGKVENQKQVSHFPTATNPLFSRRKTRAAGRASPSAQRRALRAALRVKE
jgi:hypothetical protein